MGQFERNPVILVAVLLFLLLFIVLPLINKKHSKNSFSAKDRGQRTFEALKRIEKDEQAYAATHSGRYTSEEADLAVIDPKLHTYITVTPILIQTLSATSGKKPGYVVQLSSDIVTLSEARIGTAAPTLNCVVLKSTSGVDCPPRAITNTGTVPVPTTTTG